MTSTRCLAVLERMSHHLTAAVVSADVHFQQRVLGATVNGTTYCGMRARTTGAPQNHWFGPCGDPRAAGIGTPEAIVSTWSGHREIIFDQGPLPDRLDRTRENSRIAANAIDSKLPETSAPRSSR